MATRVAVSALGSGAGVSSLSITFTGTQPIAGNKIVVLIWAAAGTTGATISSVKDNATSQNTYTASVKRVDTDISGQDIFSFWLDLPANATWSGNYSITATLGSSFTEVDGGAVAYGGLKLGAPASTNSNGSASNVTSITPGSLTDNSQSVFVAGVTDDTGANPATLTWPSPYAGQVSQTNGASQQAGSFGDGLNISGTQNPSITIDSSHPTAVHLVFENLPAGGYLGFGAQDRMRPPQVPGGFLKAFNPVAITTGPVSNIVTATDNLSAMSDTATRIVSLIRTSTDNLAAMSDIAMRIVSLPRTVTDNLAAMSDTTTRILSLPRTVTDSLAAMSDTATRASQSFLRTATDNLAALSDTPIRILSLIRTATDNLSAMSDTATAIKVIIRTATDNLSAMTDTATRAAQSFLRSPSDSLASLSETVVTVTSLSRSISDSLAALSETTTRLLSLPRTATDSLPGVAESSTRLLALVRTAQDSLSALSDNATRAAQSLVRSAIDNLASIVDNAINTGALPPLVATLLNFVRDGSLLSSVKDGSLLSFIRDSTKQGSTRG